MQAKYLMAASVPSAMFTLLAGCVAAVDTNPPSNDEDLGGLTSDSDDDSDRATVGPADRESLATILTASTIAWRAARPRAASTGWRRVTLATEIAAPRRRGSATPSTDL